MTQLTAADGHVSTRTRCTQPAPPASVVIVQEIFGVNPHIRSVVDRYASFGYRAIAPALFDRVERGVELDYTAEGVEQGRRWPCRSSGSRRLADIAAAVAHRRGHRAGCGDRVLLRRQPRLAGRRRAARRRCGRVLRRADPRVGRSCAEGADDAALRRARSRDPARPRRRDRRQPIRRCRCTCTTAPNTGSAATLGPRSTRSSAASRSVGRLEFLVASRRSTPDRPVRATTRRPRESTALPRPR